jgi:glucan phosphoethanolaminetransferase (alkaline phosphatase superfamily)
MNAYQWGILILNLMIISIWSYLFRWQRSALMFSRSVLVEQGINLGSHMALLPSWQVMISLPVSLVKWCLWVGLWFFFPWYIPIIFLLIGFGLIVFHSATTSDQEHRCYFEKKANVIRSVADERSF